MRFSRRLLGAVHRLVRWASVACITASCRTNGSAPVDPTNTATTRAEAMLRSRDVELFVTAVRPPRTHATIVAVHGGPFVVTKALAEVERLTEHGFTVWWYLQRGLAPSSMPDAADGLTIASYADDLAEVIGAAARVDPNGRVVVVAFSWGGLPAVVAASRSDPRISGLVLVNPASPSEGQMLRDWANTKDRRDWSAALDEPYGYPAWRDCASFLAALPPSSAPPSSASARLPACSDTLGLKVWQANDGFDVSSEARAIDLPVLVIRGEKDPLAGAAAFAALIPGAELAVLEECGHMVMSDDSCRGRTLQTIVDWHARHADDSRPRVPGRPR